MFTDATLRAAMREDNLIPYDDGERPVKINYEAEIGKFDAMQHTAERDRRGVVDDMVDDMVDEGRGFSILPDESEYRGHPDNSQSPADGTDIHSKSPRTIDDDVADSDVINCDDLADYHDNIADDPSEHMDEFTQAIRKVCPSAADLYMHANAYSSGECSFDRGRTVTNGHDHDRFMTQPNEIPSLGAGSYRWRAPDPYNRDGVTYASPYANSKFASQPAYPTASTSLTMLNSIMDKVEFIEADLTELRETCDQTSQLCEDIDKGTATVIRQITALVSLVRTLATEMASSAESIRRIEERLDLVEAQSSGDGGNRNLLDTSSPGNGPTNIVSNGPIAA